jgi:hypothetical protein
MFAQVFEQETVAFLPREGRRLFDQEKFQACVLLEFWSKFFVLIFSNQNS